jgi:hypothetical protein
MAEHETCGDQRPTANLNLVLQYFWCLPEGTLTESCPAGTYWNAAQNHCDWPVNVAMGYAILLSCFHISRVPTRVI